MSAPPSQPNNVADSNSRKPETTQEKQSREWIEKRVQLMKTMRAHHPHLTNVAFGAPPANGAALPMALSPDATKNNYAYLHNQQQVAAINSAQQMKAAIRTNVAADILKQTFLQAHMPHQDQSNDQTSANMGYHQLVRAQHVQASASPQSNNEREINKTSSYCAEQPPFESHTKPLPNTSFQEAQKKVMQIIQEKNTQRIHNRPGIKESTNQGAISSPPESYTKPPLETLLQESIEKKIKQKIQQKLKARRPKITAKEQALALEHLLQEKQPQMTQYPQTLAHNHDIGEVLRSQQVGSIQRLHMLDARYRADNASQGTSDYLETAMKDIQCDSRTTRVVSEKRYAPIDSRSSDRNPNLYTGIKGEREVSIAQQMSKRKQQPAGGRDESIKIQRVATGDVKAMMEARAKAKAMLEASLGAKSAPAYTDLIEGTSTEEESSKRREKETSKEEKKDAKAKQISSKLGNIIDSLQDGSICSVVKEGRETGLAKRKEMQRIYDDQIKEMESRLSMYENLETLVERIVDIQNESCEKNIVDGTLDMIHLSLKNYHMLEDTWGRLLGIDGKK